VGQNVAVVKRNGTKCHRSKTSQGQNVAVVTETKCAMENVTGTKFCSSKMSQLMWLFRAVRNVAWSLCGWTDHQGPLAGINSCLYACKLLLYKQSTNKKMVNDVITAAQ
jgi:hypothetical protein